MIYRCWDNGGVTFGEAASVHSFTPEGAALEFARDTGYTEPATVCVLSDDGYTTTQVYVGVRTELAHYVVRSVETDPPGVL